MRIGVDLDGVGHIFERSFAESLVVYTGQHHSAAAALLTGQAQSWTFYEELGLTLEQFIEVCNHGADMGILFTGHVHDGFADAMARMKAAGHTLHIITDRTYGSTPKVSQDITKLWLYDLGVEYDSLTFSADKTIVPTDVFIEDKPENYDALDAAGVLVYLVNRPWNAHHSVPARHRIESISEYADILTGSWVGA